MTNIYHHCTTYTYYLYTVRFWNWNWTIGETNLNEQFAGKEANDVAIPYHCQNKNGSRVKLYIANELRQKINGCEIVKCKMYYV